VLDKSLTGVYTVYVDSERKWFYAWISTRCVLGCSNHPCSAVCGKFSL